MMACLFAGLGAVLQILFAYLFFAAFLEVKYGKDEIGWILGIAAILNIAYAMIGVDGLYGYLLYLLVCVVLLLCVFGESGGYALSLLVFALLIPAAVDGLTAQIAAGRSETGAALAKVAGQLAMLALVPLFHRIRPLLRVRRSAPQDPDQDMLLLRQHMELQQDSMRALEQNYRLQRKSSHEFEHHLQALRGLLDQGEVEQAREYLARLKKDRSIHLMSVNSHNPVIDVILNQKHQTAQENGIKMQIRVNDLSAVDIPADSLVVVLTNLLDNAIEACRRIDGYREIRCSILLEDSLYISIRNTSAPVEIVDGKIPTSKQDSLSHGFGLMSVRFVLDKLNAEYTFGYDEGWFHFAAEIE